LTLLLANSGEDPGLESRALRVLTERKVDGLIIAPVGRSVVQEIRAVLEQGTPVVIMDRLGGLRTDQVGVENTRPMRELVAHLIGHGHRAIALAAGDLTVPTVAERRQGYLQALEDAGISVKPDYVLTGSGLAEETRFRVRELLQSPHPPSAFVAVSTETAIGVLEAARDLGLSTPEDFAFAAFDGFPHADLFRPKITTVTQPAHDIGATAMHLLIDRLSGERSTRHKTVRLEPEITYRESCGCSGSATAST
jgi:LacI family transcriptional regulator